jgi:hypothetical protein
MISIFTGEGQCREMANDTLTGVKILMGCLPGYGTNAKHLRATQPLVLPDRRLALKWRQYMETAIGAPDQVILSGMKQRIGIPSDPLIGRARPSSRQRGSLNVGEHFDPLEYVTWN